MDLAQEITNHLEWIDTIATLLNNENLAKEDFREVTRHDQCALGHWLRSEASQAFKDFPELQKLIESHEAFHRLAGSLVLFLQQGKESEAIEAQGQFINKSQEVIKYLQVLQKYAVEN